MDDLSGDDKIVRKLLFEYQMAQDMLKHYDNLNWQIGSIFIGSILILTGVVLAGYFQVSNGNNNLSIFICIGLPAISSTVLICWRFWFKRHRILYNLRNEVLHRIEHKLDMFHHLRVVDSNKPDNITPEQTKILDEARTNSGHSNFPTFYNGELEKLQGPSGHGIATFLTVFIPTLQLVLLLLLKFYPQL